MFGEMTQFFRGYIGGWELFGIGGFAIVVLFLLARSLGIHHDE